MSPYEMIFHWEEFYYYYNCTFYDVNTIPVETRRNYAHATVLLVAGIFVEIIYLPCLWALYRLSGERDAPSCYRIMLYLGCLECVAVVIPSAFAAYFSATGVVYCSTPVFMYVVCEFSMAAWYAEGVTVVILALNRCTVSVDALLASRLFSARAMKLWLWAPNVVGVAFVFFSPPNIYSPIDGSTYYNPHRRYAEDREYYHSRLNKYYNISLVFVIIIIYSIFCVAIFRKFRKSTGDKSSRKLYLELRISMQVLVTCSMVMMTSFGFIYTKLLNSFAFFVMVFYILYQGTPALIYLSMNAAVRRMVFVRSGLCKFLPARCYAPQRGTRSAAVTAIDVRTVMTIGALATSTLPYGVKQRARSAAGKETRRATRSGTATSRVAKLRPLARMASYPLHIG